MGPFISGGSRICLNLDDAGCRGAVCAGEGRGEGSRGLLVFLGWEPRVTESLFFEVPDPYRGSVGGLPVLLRIPEGPGQPLPWSWVFDFRFQLTGLCVDRG